MHLSLLSRITGTDSNMLIALVSVAEISVLAVALHTNVLSQLQY
jgi:hypothetical protein